jgi:predicted XRE-type DNA-binding protein
MRDFNGIDNTIIDKEVIKRFWRYVFTTSNCWEWKGTKQKRGYGKLKIKTKTYLAHRVSYFIHFGVCPNTQLVTHKCDNPNCVRPDHLQLGTHKDNTKDRVVRNRGAVGEKHGMCKLSDTQVKAILTQLAYKTQNQIACDYGVDQTTISDLITRTRQNFTHTKRDLLIAAKTSVENRNKKLTTHDVVDIKIKLQAGQTQTKVAQEYGVNVSTINKIALNKNWKWV